MKSRHTNIRNLWANPFIPVVFIGHLSDNIVYEALLVKSFAEVFPVYECSFFAELELRCFSGNTWEVKNRNV